MAADTVLRAEGLTKEFKGFVAVDEVSLAVKRGSIHALIGPNGAGKTTFFNLLSKFIEPTAGRIFYHDREITGLRPSDVARLGIVRSFQISAVFGHLTALENVRVALQRSLGTYYQFWRSDRSLNSLNTRAKELLEDVGLIDQRDRLAVELPYGGKRALEIATTLALEPELMLLDEPMAGIAHDELDRIVELVRRVAKDRTVLMVEHNLSVVATLSDTITVLARGQVLAEGGYAEISSNPAVIEAYMGTPDEPAPTGTASHG
jgi:branched-chain amino acid transport system ATP-binding protein